MSQFLTNVVALIQHFAPQLAALATSFPGAFKLFEKLTGWLADASGKLSSIFPRLAPFAAELKVAGSFMAAHEAEIIASATGFCANLPKLIEMLHGFDPSGKLTAIPPS